MITQQKSMPTYEYACKACGHQFEEIQKMSDPPIDVCPKCGQKSAQRLISQGNFILKGGGWYTTGGYGEPAKKSESSSSSTGGASSKSDKGDAKTETKTDAKPAGVPDAALPPAIKTDSGGSGGGGSGGGSSTSPSGSGRNGSSSSQAA